MSRRVVYVDDLVFRRENTAVRSWRGNPRDTYAERVGDANEKRVLLLLLLVRPPWLLSAEQTRRFGKEDGEGFDIIIRTDRGILGLQVKSAARKAQEFRKRAREAGTLRRIGIVCVKAHSGATLDDAKVTAQILSELGRIRDGRLP